MERIFFKPTLKNPSQGARFEYLRKLRGYTDENIVKYFGWHGDDPFETFRKWRTNERSPRVNRMEDIAKFFCVSINAVKKYDFNKEVDQVYYHMWEEEQFPYSDFVVDIDSYKRTVENERILKGLNKWKEMREKRINGEISDEEYVEWKLHFEL